RKRVSRGGAFGIVVEVDVHGAVFFSPTFDARRPFPKRGLAIARCVFSGVTVQTDVNHVSCHSIPHWPVGRIRHADRDSVALEAVRYFIIEPRLIAKLDRVSRAFPMSQIFQERLQSSHVFFQKCRKLPHHSGEPFAERRRRFATTNYRFFHIEQLFVVRDITVPFDGKSKCLRCLVAPFLERAFLLQSVEGAVHLASREPFRAKTKLLFLWRVAVETVAPAFLIPATGTDVCFASHYSIRG